MSFHAVLQAQHGMHRQHSSQHPACALSHQMPAYAYYNCQKEMSSGHGSDAAHVLRLSALAQHGIHIQDR